MSPLAGPMIFRQTEPDQCVSEEGKPTTVALNILHKGIGWGVFAAWDAEPWQGDP